MEGESWEELDAEELTHGAQSLRWLVWVRISLFSAVFCFLTTLLVIGLLFSLRSNTLCIGIHSLQPKIDKDSQETLAIECPRIVVNPRSSPFGFRGIEIPQEALMQFALDDPIVKEIDPKTWAVSVYITSTSRTPLLQVSSSNDMSIAEKFRLAYIERDTRLAPKRAKNARQHQRRAERERLMMDSRAKALVLASKATKSVARNL